MDGDASEWLNPANNFAYSRGSPGGQDRRTLTTPLLVKSTGEPVECKVTTHTCTLMEQLQDRLRQELEEQTQLPSPSKDVFNRTAAYISAIRQTGCLSVAYEETHYNSVEAAAQERLLEHRTEMQRGYSKPNACKGRLLFSCLFDGRPVVKCEHYSGLENKDHFFDSSVGNGGYDLDYLEAVLCEDQEEIDRIELQAAALGYGPRTKCRTITNFSSQRTYCPWDHRDNEDFRLEQPKMEVVPCNVTFRQYFPLMEDRKECPFVLIVSRGIHTHPIPLPAKTPGFIKSELQVLLRKLDVDLADLTPRRFLAHPTVKSYLSDRFPQLKFPTISDLHISLANRSHLKIYIDQIKKECFPEGTGWKGLLHLKQQQDRLLTNDEYYIRRMLIIPLDQTEEGDVENEDERSKDDLRVVICMTPEASRRLGHTQYLQSDIAFKRIIGFYEFEISTWDRDLNAAITLCRVYVNRKSATAHCLILHHIDEVLKEDIGRGLQWRHIHGASINDYGKGEFILQWVVDQDRGQALGIGLHLKEIALEHPNKYDLHEPHRLLVELQPYDHLRRFLTLCTVHYGRNIRSCPVTDGIRNLMRSLLCVEHGNWNSTLQEIKEAGGKAGRDWVADKESLPFVFPGICWQFSFIPYDIWMARSMSTNTSEAAHNDVNREGVRCTLVGATKKAMHYDFLKIGSLKVGLNLY
ncbi:hypothetical protein K435DRAFT_704653 [Dendrothele bispora CBS 962.96]|uniref:Uncharacterized protein n=1 Tax=Dendrothele bispora (strain CBS 962.96) TaxID=1314807 RepID=A0A4V4HAR0_DENBC|nr:hypothetical protein K435DRAFT_704653 [Dendrothele bispora CBS 962.96]